MGVYSQNSSEDFEAKVHALVGRLRQIQAENARLRSALASREEELGLAKAEIARLNNDYVRLKLAKAFGLSENSKRQAHNRITKLVRDIDTCIALLKK